MSEQQQSSNQNQLYSNQGIVPQDPTKAALITEAQSESKHWDSMVKVLRKYNRPYSTVIKDDLEALKLFINSPDLAYVFSKDHTNRVRNFNENFSKTGANIFAATC